LAVAFTESTLGRFLLAIELYAIVVFVLISSFYNYVPKPADAKIKSTFEGVPEIKRSSTFRVPPPANSPCPATDNHVLTIDTSYRNHPYNESRPERPSRSSTASRLSSWIVSRRMSRRRSVGSGDRAQLWNQDQAERGESPVDQTVMDGRVSPYNSPIERQNWNDPMPTTIMNDPLPNIGERSVSRWTATPNSTSDSLSAKNTRNNDFDPEALKAPRMPRFDSTTYSIGSYYGYGPGKSVPSTPVATVRQTESPIYGLSGIIRRTSQGRQTPNSIAHTRSSTVSFTELLRQQTELDNSIAALRLLSEHAPGQDSTVPPDLTAAVTNPDSSKDLNRSNSSVGLPPSSGRSDFSLSNFPEPPLTLTSAVNGLPSPTSTVRARSDRNEERRLLSSNGVTDLPVPKMPVVLDDYPTTPQSLLDSPGRNSGEDITMSGNMSRMKVNSAGTQYDVTSFIGSALTLRMFGIRCIDNFCLDLTTPGFKKGPAFDRLTDIDSQDGVSEINSTTNTPTTVIMQVPNPPGSASATRPIYVDIGPALSPSAPGPFSGPAVAVSGASTAQAASQKPMPALPPRAMRSAPVPEMNTPNRPAHRRKTSSNTSSQSNNLSLSSAGTYVIGAVEEAGVNSRRRASPGGNVIGLPARPRLTISGPKAQPRDGKSDQAPSAFERPRPPPLVLNKNAKPGGLYSN
jgi:hypothetical protein